MRVNELYMSLHYLKRAWSRLVWHQTPDRDMSSVIDMTLSFNNEEFPWLNFVAISLQLTRHDSSVVRFLQLGRRQCSKKMFDDVILCRSGLHSLSRLILTFIYIEHFEQDNKFFSIMENIRNMKGRKKEYSILHVFHFPVISCSQQSLKLPRSPKLHFLFLLQQRYAYIQRESGE